MKRLNQLIYQLAGHTPRQGTAVKAAVPFAILRVLRVMPDEVPAVLIKSVSILEWVGGLLVLFIFLRQQSNSQTEKENAQVS